MEQKANYMNIMIDSLKKKIKILDEIIEINNQQREIIKEIKKNITDYETTLDKKQVLIDQLNKLDSGFQVIYYRVKRELVDKSDDYKEEISQMQMLISLITDKSIEIQKGEEMNRQVIAQQFILFKKEVKGFKDSKRIVNKYYNSMQKMTYIPSQFLDKKK